jgi:hypothetical protein
MKTLTLAPDVYVCLTSEGPIFLDLRKNKYVGLPANDTSQLKRLLTGGDCSHSELAQDLLQLGLLAEQAAVRRFADEPKPYAMPFESIFDDISPDMGSVTPSRILKFIRAYILSRTLLNFRSLHAAVRRAQRRVPQDAHHPAPFSREYIAEYVAFFRKVRPFFYRSRNNCLFDSLVLLEFLSSAGIAARWVFGVSPSPFAAHCWVQSESIALNGRPEYIRQFSPILVT